jgi:hypothetical protein
MLKIFLARWLGKFEKTFDYDDSCRGTAGGETVAPPKLAV